MSCPTILAKAPAFTASTLVDNSPSVNSRTPHGIVINFDLPPLILIDQWSNGASGFRYQLGAVSLYTGVGSYCTTTSNMSPLAYVLLYRKLVDLLTSRCRISQLTRLISNVLKTLGFTAPPISNPE